MRSGHGQCDSAEVCSAAVLAPRHCARSDAGGEGFEAHTALESISTDDLSMRFLQRVELGVRLFTAVHFLWSGQELWPDAHVAMRGWCAEPLPGAA
jgi:hypothetical protein